jgi:hypothetical protein
MLTSVDLGRMAANLRLADNTHQRVDECIALKSTIETPAVGSLDTSRHPRTNLPSTSDLEIWLLGLTGPHVLFLPGTHSRSNAFLNRELSFRSSSSRT